MPVPDIQLDLTLAEAQGLLDDLRVLRGATAVNWKTETPWLNQLGRTLARLLHGEERESQP